MNKHVHEMTPEEATNFAIDLAGGNSKVAALYKPAISAAAITHWRRKGCPPKRVPTLCEAGGWVVQPHHVRPDVFTQHNASSGVQPSDAHST